MIQPPYGSNANHALRNPYASRRLRPAPVTQPAAQPVAIPAPATSNVRDIIAETLVMTYDDNGKPAYKVKGFPYSGFGVRIWPEILPALGVDPANLKPGSNPLPAGLIVRLAMSDDGKPRKVISKGDGSAMVDLGSNGHSPQAPEPPEPPYNENESPF